MDELEFIPLIKELEHLIILRPEEVMVDLIPRKYPDEPMPLVQPHPQLPVQPPLTEDLPPLTEDMPDEVYIPEIEYKVLVNSLHWTRSYPKNTPGDFNTPLTIPRAITSDFLVGLSALFSLPGWDNVLEDMFMQVWTTEDGAKWEYIDDVQVPPGRYKNVSKLTRAINAEMDMFAYDHGFRTMPKFFAEADPFGDWSVEYWPAHFTKYTYMKENRTTRMKNYNICLKMPLSLCRMLGIHADHSVPWMLWYKDNIKSTEHCFMAGDYNKLYLMSNLSAMPIFSFSPSTDSYRLPLDQVTYTKMKTNVQQIEDLHFWFVDERGRKVEKRSGPVGFQLLFKESYGDRPRPTPF